MTGAEKKEYLKSYRLKIEEIERLEAELEALRIHAMYPSSGKAEGKRRHRPHDLSDYATQEEKLKTRIEETRQECAIRCREIIEAIENLQGDTQEKLEKQRNLLVARYIKGENWDTIEKEINYGRTHMHRIHARALDNFNPKE